MHTSISITLISQFIHISHKKLRQILANLCVIHEDPTIFVFSILTSSFRIRAFSWLSAIEFHYKYLALLVSDPLFHFQWLDCINLQVKKSEPDNQMYSSYQLTRIKYLTSVSGTLCSSWHRQFNERFFLKAILNSSQNNYIEKKYIIQQKF